MMKHAENLGTFLKKYNIRVRALGVQATPHDLFTHVATIAGSLWFKLLSSDG